MKPYMKILAAMLLVVLLATSAALPIAAVSAVYPVGREYRSSPYYDALMAYRLTGDMRYDVLAIAFSQMGYHEGNNESEMHGGNTGGERNFAEYNRIYGKLDNGEGNGVSYGYQWCAAFVSWCMRHAGVPQELAVTEVSCNRMMRWHRENGTYRARESGYDPLPGDLILFHKGSGVPNHIGLVVGTDEDRVYVIDGNGREEMVTTHVYRRNSMRVLGYCVPDYVTQEGTVFDFPLSGHQPGALYTAGTLIAAAALLGGATLAVVVIVKFCRRKLRAGRN